MAGALGLAGIAPPRRLRVSLVMTGFEALMPLVGLAVGVLLGRAFGSSADYIAVAVLVAFGLYTLRRDEDGPDRAGALASETGWSAALLGLGVSVDELAIAFTLGILRLPVVTVIALIAVQAPPLSQLGMRVGARLSLRARQHAERLAGAVLLMLGVGLLLERLVSS